jgi:hypothetical protein
MKSTNRFRSVVPAALLLPLLATGCGQEDLLDDGEIIDIEAAGKATPLIPAPILLSSSNF